MSSNILTLTIDDKVLHLPLASVSHWEFPPTGQMFVVMRTGAVKSIPAEMQEEVEARLREWFEGRRDATAEQAPKPAGDA